MKLRFAIAATLVSGAALAEPSVERGEYLVTGPAACGNCHSPLGPDGFIEGMELGGRLVIELPEFTAYAPNITPAGEVASWSDDDVVRVIREGMRPDGRVLGPPMPFELYRNMSDDDVRSIVAYLRTVPAVDNEVPRSTYNIPLPPSHGEPVGSVPGIPAGATVEYGEYLAGPIAHCVECHTPMGPHGPMFDTALGQGGFEFPGPWGVSVAANLTSHEDGLAGYSDADLAAMITTGVRPDGSHMLPPMPYSFFAKMTKDDLSAIILYLRTLPPLPDSEG